MPSSNGKIKTDKIRTLGIDPKDLKTSLFCHWEMEKLDYHLDRMVSYLVENRLPRSLTNLVIEEIEEARTELKDIFDSLYEKEGRLDR
tara:strand:+ start:392 stop:655 length:264 start_codon:yes stop_codon:yes gene_type:complete